MKQTFLYYFILVSICTALNGSIIESDTVSIILTYAKNPGTLIIFDIDDTVARPQQQLGSDQWFSFMIGTKIAQEYTPTQAVNAVLPLYVYLQSNISLISPEAQTPHLVADLAAQGFYTMGLSARNFQLAEITNEQLNNLGINFAMPDAVGQDFFLSLPETCYYSHTIIFAGNNNKGDALLALLDKTGFTPQSIIFIDDKLYNVQSVEKAVESRNIPFIGIRYSQCDHFAQEFDPLTAAAQLEALKARNKTGQSLYTPCNIDFFKTLGINIMNTLLSYPSYLIKKYRTYYNL